MMEGGIEIIAGPCSAESREEVLSSAAALKALGVETFRAGLWKPRTSPSSFEGVGAVGLPWLMEVRDTLGMRVATEVASPDHVKACLAAGLDLVWLGARTTANPFLVQEIADSLAGSEGVTVMVKNPVNPELELWAGAIERLRGAGLTDIVAVHRGFSSFEKLRYRNNPLWQIPVQLRGRFPGFRMLCDPSHIAGDATLVPEVAQKALDLGFDGLMVEVHPDPEKALSDSSQQLSPRDFEAMAASLKVRKAGSTDAAFNERLCALRAHIDEIDDSLVSLLADRMAASREIGELKKSGGVAIVQSSRWEEVLSSALALGRSRGLPEDLVRDLFTLLHEASISVQ